MKNFILSLIYALKKKYILKFFFQEDSFNILKERRGNCTERSIHRKKIEYKMRLFLTLNLFLVLKEILHL